MDFRRLGLRLLLVAVLVAAQVSQFSTRAYAQADYNEDVANCEPVKDPAVDEAQKICAWHAGCAMVKSMYRTCTKIKRFFKNLGDSMATKAKETDNSWESQPTATKRSLLSRLGITSDEVFEAAAPTPTPSRGMKQAEAQVDPIVREYRELKAKQLARQKLADGSYYEGTLKNGVPDGVGIRIRPDGDMLRGEFDKGRAEGLGVNMNVNGTKIVGHQHEDTAGKVTLEGQGAVQRPDGTVFAGKFQASDVRGMMEMSWADGTTSKDFYDDHGGRIAQGPHASRGMTAQDPVLPPGYGSSLQMFRNALMQPGAIIVKKSVPCPPGSVAVSCQVQTVGQKPVVSPPPRPAPIYTTPPPVSTAGGSPGGLLTQGRAQCAPEIAAARPISALRPTHVGNWSVEGEIEIFTSTDIGFFKERMGHYRSLLADFASPNGARYDGWQDNVVGYRLDLCLVGARLRQLGIPNP